MSLSLLVDEDTQAKLLVSLLRAAGHDVVTVQEASLMAEPDIRVLDYARRENRLLLTRNCDDFHALHRAQPQHPGIIAIYQDQHPSKNLSYAAIPRCLANLEASGLQLAGQFVVLNAWNY